MLEKNQGIVKEQRRQLQAYLEDISAYTVKLLNSENEKKELEGKLRHVKEQLEFSDRQVVMSKKEELEAQNAELLTQIKQQKKSLAISEDQNAILRAQIESQEREIKALKA